jgi:glucose dehydrogenase
MKFLRLCFAAVLAVSALYLLFMGGKLALIGGSWYYALIGLTYLVSALLMARQSRLSAYLIIGALVVTLAWSAWEVGGAYWGWLPRLLVPLGFAIVAALIHERPLCLGERRRLSDRGIRQ